MEKEKYKTAFISDLHLSTFSSKIDQILLFFNNYEFDSLYIVGDLIDIWRIRIADYWPNKHTLIIEKLIEEIKKETQIIYIIGNHDEFLSEFTDIMGPIKISKKEYYQIKDKKLIIMHGHQFDGLIIKLLKPFIIVGTLGYDLIAKLSKWYNLLRIKLGKTPLSLSSYLKQNSKNIINILSNYEKNILKYIKRKKTDGIIFGHLHKPKMKIKDGLFYINTGDFVNNCSFILEDYEGNLKLMKYEEEKFKMIKNISLA